MTGTGFGRPAAADELGVTPLERERLVLQLGVPEADDVRSEAVVCGRPNATTPSFVILEIQTSDEAVTTASEMSVSASVRAIALEIRVGGRMRATHGRSVVVQGPLTPRSSRSYRRVLAGAVPDVQPLARLAMLSDTDRLAAHAGTAADVRAPRRLRRHEPLRDATAASPG